MIFESALLCLALNIYHEARDQSTKGMVAVAEVTLNRAEGKHKQVCDVVFEPYQFSWANSLTTVSPQQRVKNAKRFVPRDQASWRQSRIVAQRVLTGNYRPVVGDATHYFNPDKLSANPRWSAKMTYIGRVGDHKFYRASL